MKLPEGYEPHELPADYTGPLFIEGQMREYGEACVREWQAENERLKRQVSELEASPMSEEALDILRGENFRLKQQVLEQQARDLTTYHIRQRPKGT